MKKLFLILFLVWTVIMGYLLLSPGSDLPSIKMFENQDKVAHLILFGTWTFLLVQVFNRRSVTILIGSIVVAGITEWMQYYIPNRTPDFYDFLLDVLGLLIGGIAGIYLKKELFRAE